MTYLIIYKIKNNINEKVYIGLTTCSLEYRWKKHLTEGKNEKNKKQWILNNEIIDINNYKPVSTISESGE